MQAGSGWIGFIAAFVVFFLTHSIPVRPPVKAWLVQRIGARGFTIAYSVLSLVVLFWLIAAAGRAPYVELWPHAPWQSWVSVILMLAACLIAAQAVGKPNPLSFGGRRNIEFDPDHPGIVGWFRHPLLVALFVWSLAHIVPNGNLAHVILFGVFALFALLGMRIIDRRKKRLLGAEWQRLAAVSPGFAMSRDGVVRTAAGIGAFGLLLDMHESLFGISPLP